MVALLYKMPVEHIAYRIAHFNMGLPRNGVLLTLRIFLPFCRGALLTVRLK